MNLWRESREREIFEHLIHSQQSSEDDHHIVPLLDSFEDQREPSRVFCVMPLLRQFNLPQFETVPELVDLFKQLHEVRVVLRPFEHVFIIRIQGLVYMHSVGVAHRYDFRF